MKNEWGKIFPRKVGKEREFKRRWVWEKWRISAKIRQAGRQAVACPSDRTLSPSSLEYYITLFQPVKFLPFSKGGNSGGAAKAAVNVSHFLCQFLLLFHISAPVGFLKVFMKIIPRILQSVLMETPGKLQEFMPG